MMMVATVMGESTRMEYTHHKVVKVCGQKPHALFDSPAEVDVWKTTVTEGGVCVTAAVAKGKVRADEGHTVSVVVEDLGELVAGSYTKSNSTQGGGDEDWWSNYHTYDEVKAWAADVAGAFPQTTTYVPSIGTSIEGRDIFALRITAEKNKGRTDIPQVYIQGLQHAREWAGGASTQYALYSLAANVGSLNLIDRVEVIIVPIVNPDGYVYSWTHNRLWRKNRRNNGDGSFGVDLNRNWLTPDWCATGASKNPSSDVYCGTSAFSEPESTASSTYLLQSAPNVILFLDIHSYGDILMTPYGYTRSLPPHYTEVEAAGVKIKNAVQAVHGTSWVSGPAANWGLGAGGADDYAYVELTPVLKRQIFSFTFEVGPDSTGFLLPPAQIRSKVQEVYAGIQESILIALDDPLPSDAAPHQPADA